MNTYYLEGFYEKENDGISDFRWMQNRAVFKIKDIKPKDNIKFNIGCDLQGKDCRLKIRGQKTLEIELVDGWQEIFIKVDEIGIVSDEYILSCDYVHSVIGDSRILALMIGNIEHIKAENSPEVLYREGFYGLENDSVRKFRWMSNKAYLYINKEFSGEWIIFEVGYPGTIPIDFTIQGDKSITVKLLPGWQQLGFELKGFIDNKNSRINFICKYNLQCDNVQKKLSVMIGDISIGRATNYIKNSSKLTKSLFKDTILDSYPSFLIYSTSEKCNLKCAMCMGQDESMSKIVHSQPNEIEKEHIKKGKHIYEQLLPYISYLQLHGWGEVLIGDDFWEALDISKSYVNEKLMEIEINTNGLLLTPKKRKALLSSPLTSIAISVDAATAKTYKRIRGGNFEKLINNIKALVKENKEHKNQLNLSMAFVLMRENIEELPDFIKLAKLLGVETVSFWPLNSRGINMPIKIRENDFLFYYKQQMLIYYPRLTMKKIDEAEIIAKRLNIRIGITPYTEKDYEKFIHDDLPYPVSPEIFDHYIKENDFLCNYDKNKNNNRENYKYCYFPWNTARVDLGGRFAPCCYLPQFNIASIFDKDNFDSIWNGELMQDLRQHIINGKVHPLCENAQCRFVDKKF